MSEREFKIVIAIQEPRPRHTVFHSERRFGWTGDWKPEQMRAEIVRELAKHFADSVVTIMVDEEIK